MNSVWRKLDRAVADAGLALNLVAETSAVSILLAAVQDGRGWTILPASALAGAQASHPDIVGMAIDAPDFTRRVSLCLSEQAQTSLACLSVHALVPQLVRELVEQGWWRGVTLSM